MAFIIPSSVLDVHAGESQALYTRVRPTTMDSTVSPVIAAVGGAASDIRWSPLVCLDQDDHDVFGNAQQS